MLHDFATGDSLPLMRITAVVEKDAIKLPPGVHLPDGTAVRVEPLDPVAPATLGQRYAEFIGIVTDMPPDLAENHDHYLYGAAKRNR